MCGLAGWIGHITVDDETVAAVALALRHRGPDGTGSKRFDNAGLIHTRLAIIDLSPLGDQPMANEDETVWVVFNGEIYNHDELRRDLEGRGHKFRGASDTEVLPHLYEEYGTQMFERLRGMFAVAVFDRRANTLTLARDRFGIKPMFFAPRREAVAFASEIQALRLFPGIDLTPDRQAISDCAAFLYVPAPRTIFRGIEALEPGCSVHFTWSATGLELDRKRFHRWAQRIDPELGLEAAADIADTLVDNAVRRQLESDVPLGVMLSGGIDSSLIAAAAKGDGDLLSFNVRTADPRLDETASALTVADHLHTTHSTIPMEEGAADWEDFTKLLRGLGQPMADPALFAVAAVSRAMREHVTVALSGDGGDELFGGYRVFRKIEALSRLCRAPSAVLTAAGVGLGPLAALGLIGSTVPAQISALATLDDTGVVQAEYTAMQNSEHASLVRPDADIEPVRRLFERTWETSGTEGSRLERLSSLTLEIGVRLLLANKFLVKSDMASMRESLEVRVPLLDEDLADFAMTLSHRLRVKGRSDKRVLREVARRHLPANIASRPKQGFGIMLERWVDNRFRSAAREVLLDAGSRLPDFFERATYEPWVLAFAERKELPTLTQQAVGERVMMLAGLDSCLRA